MTTLFARQWNVIVGEQLRSQENELLSTSELRTVFKIRKTLEKEPNTADLKIYNLSADSRGKLSKKGMRVIIQAGYAGDMATIFSGDSRTTDHERDKADWATHLQCGDGEHAYNFARFNESFGPNADVATIIKRVAAGMSISTGNLSDAVLAGLPVTTFKHGFSAFGPASQVLDKLMRAAKLSWSIQHGALQILTRNAQGLLKPIQAEVFRLSSATGLVGSPTHSAPDKKNKKPSILKCRALLNPRLMPGYLVEIESVGVKRGKFFIRTVEHSGDSHGDDWFTDVECEARNE